MAPDRGGLRVPPAGSVTVGTGSAAPYEVRVESDLDLSAAVSEALPPGAAAVLTDSSVGPLHADAVVGALAGAGWEISEVVTVPAGEPSKSLAVYETVLRRLAAAGLSRDGTLFALGGGVVGDLGGFVASSYMRGIYLVQLPTSLLAMVDSSVGGKVGLDLPEGKNLVGAFLQPRLVAANLDWLLTLPDRELSQGLAEVVKMGILSGGSFFDDLHEYLGPARERDAEALRRLILHSVRYKAAVVAADERERGLRAVLNYGHTVAHGLEAAAGYDLPHGEAVAVGMLAAARLSHEKLGPDLVEVHRDLLRAAGLPLSVPATDVEAVLNAMGRDKKRRSSDGEGRYRFVLLEGIGRPVHGVPVTASEARAAIGSILER
ncbi:3-dehydroquinate synthase [Rubrobacter marinus]|uniref:3-dehydroquinate synthase n=1 Tax=Rubrobacter marinus TaxID=2653852 RepID=A0A6G8PXE3_9ACTN|nr:3-dehydroquinate synthase [Rubrobacter marinus]QIN78866.1 3-dehydroquinate synthase [Rubrobacter marinus]